MEPTADAHEALRRLRRQPEELTELAEQLDITLMVVFGSVLASPGVAVDVDVAIMARDPLDVLALMEALYQLTGYERFDVLDLRRADVVARVQALQRGETLVERRRGEHNEQLVQALALYWDTQWLRDLELETPTMYACRLRGATSVATIWRMIPSDRGGELRQRRPRRCRRSQRWTLTVAQSRPATCCPRLLRRLQLLPR